MNLVETVWFMFASLHAFQNVSSSRLECLQGVSQIANMEELINVSKYSVVKISLDGI